MSLNLQYSVREGFLGLGRARLATLVSVSTVAVTMTLMSIFLILTLHVDRFIGLFKQKMMLEVYFDNSLSNEAVQSLQHKIASQSGVRDIMFISKEEALENFRKEFGEDPEAILGKNPLPASFHVNLDATARTHSKIILIVNQIEQFNGVTEVIYHGRLIQIVNQYSRVILIVTILLFVIVLLSALFLIGNTLRLIIYAQRENIEIMELVGATSRFIHRPFIVQGILQGGIGGLISTGILWLIVFGISLRFPNLLSVPIWIFMLPVVFGLVLGWAGSILGLRHFLKA